jgi:opacity protein-like surface antigen
MRQSAAILAMLTAFALTTPALAQDKRGEVSVLAGWTFSDGVSGDPILAGDGNRYDRVDPKDSFKWGFDVGVHTSDNVQVGFLFGQQLSQLTFGGTATTEVGDLTINTYHGYIAYNFGERDAPMRPYAMVGLGATNFASVDFSTPGGRVGTTGSETQFSTTWGAGVKFFRSGNVGARAGIQWTPTYIKSDAAGWWCDPYWGCYLTGNAQYSNQWDFSGGVTFRF